MLPLHFQVSPMIFIDESHPRYPGAVAGSERVRRDRRDVQTPESLRAANFRNRV
jgi:hypothetical protein